MLRYAVVGLVASALGCGPDHGPPRVRALPKPDASPLGGAARSPRNANYKIDVRLDVQRHTLAAQQTLVWTNTGGSRVDTLPFHLYLNGFKNENSLFMTSAGGTVHNQRVPDDMGWGWIQVDQITVDGSEIKDPKAWKMPGLPDESVAELALSTPLEPGATVSIGMKFTAQLPRVIARTGYLDEFHLVGQWFPKIGVRAGPTGSEHWECRAFHANNEFFSDFGVYDVTITVPSTYVVGATGVLANATEAAGNSRSFTYHAEDVHDFAWVADPYMEVMTRTAQVENRTVDVRVMYRPEQRHYATRHLEAAVSAVESFSNRFVAYPWPVLTVVDPPVEAQWTAGGMEYPTFVTTAGDTVFARRGIRLPESVTVHEVGHNWFQGMLASNEPDEPWLDEGINSWADVKAMTELAKGSPSGVDWMGLQADYAALQMAIEGDPGNVPAPIASAAASFPDGAAYGVLSYQQTLRALLTLEQYVGTTKFAAAIKAYATQFAFKHPSGRDFFDTMTKELGQDLSWYFGPVWHDVGAMELSIRAADCVEAHPARGVFDSPATPTVKKTIGPVEAPLTGSYRCEVVIANSGNFHVPVEVEFRFVDGSKWRPEEKWDDRGNSHWYRYSFDRSSPLAEVIIDPDNKIALGTSIDRRYRLAADGAAAMRAGSWFSSAAQTFMQVVGP